MEAKTWIVKEDNISNFGRENVINFDSEPINRYLGRKKEEFTKGQHGTILLIKSEGKISPGDSIVFISSEKSSTSSTPVTIAFTYSVAKYDDFSNELVFESKTVGE